MSILSSYNVDSPEYGQPFKLDVVEGLDAVHLDNIEQQWRPVMGRQRDAALLQLFLLPEQLRTEETFRDILGKVGAPDSHWDWRLKCAIAPGSNRKVFAILNGVHVEAVMLLKFGLNSRMDLPALPLVYVDFVAAAPWNRVAIQSPERFRGMGTMMLGTAVEVSRMHGFEGRCGLHSLVPAEGFYRRIGMKEFGVDTDYHDMRYFEFSAQAARTFTG